MGLRAFVAAPYQDSRLVRETHLRLCAVGIAPTSTWAETAPDAPENLSRFSDAEKLQICDDNDRDIERADVLLLLAREDAGRECFAEARFALTLGMPVVWVGFRTSGAWRRGVCRAPSYDHALEMLERIARHWDGRREAA